MSDITEKTSVSETTQTDKITDRRALRRIYLYELSEKFVRAS